MCRVVPQSHEGAMRVPLMGVVRTRAEEVLELRIYSCESRRAVAIVRGSSAYVLLALAAAGLTAPVTPRGLRKHRDGSDIAFIREQPANGNAKRAR